MTIERETYSNYEKRGTPRNLPHMTFARTFEGLYYIEIPSQYRDIETNLRHQKFVEPDLMIEEHLRFSFVLADMFPNQKFPVIRKGTRSYQSMDLINSVNLNAWEKNRLSRTQEDFEHTAYIISKKFDQNIWLLRFQPTGAIGQIYLIPEIPQKFPHYETGYFLDTRGDYKATGVDKADQALALHSIVTTYLNTINVMGKIKSRA